MRFAMTRPGARRTLAVVATAGIAAVTLAGCSSSDDNGSSGDKTTIRFLYATGDDTWNAAADAVATAFNEQSDSTIVKLDPLPAGSDYATAMKTMDATGNWPAIVDMRDTMTYISAGKLAPIPAEVTDLISPEAFGATDDGNVYTVPASALNGEIGMNIVYDKDYFEANGLEVPTTYDEFIKLMDAIKANGDEPLATAAGEVWPSDQLWKPLAAPVFAQYSDQGGFWNAVVTGDASIEDLRAPLQELLDITDNYVLEGWQSTADAQTTTLLVNHQAIMATSSAGIGRLNDINKVNPDFNAGLFVIPADDGSINVLKNSVVGDTAQGLAISQQAKDDGAEYDSAVEFLKFFYSVDGANILEEQGSLAPNIKASADVTRNTAIPGSEDYFALLENPKLNWFKNDSSSPAFSAFNTFFRQTRIEMQDGQITLDEAIEKAQAEFDKTVDSAS